MNAKDEFIKAVGTHKVLAAKIEHRLDIYLLPKNHSAEDYKKFIECLNFDYNSGYGSQNVYGTVWLDGGIWLERGEYDGSEWWEFKQLPKLPEELQ